MRNLKVFFSVVLIVNYSINLVSSDFESRQDAFDSYKDKKWRMREQRPNARIYELINSSVSQQRHELACECIKVWSSSVGSLCLIYNQPEEMVCRFFNHGERTKKITIKMPDNKLSTKEFDSLVDNFENLLIMSTPYLNSLSRESSPSLEGTLSENLTNVRQKTVELSPEPESQFIHNTVRRDRDSSF